MQLDIRTALIIATFVSLVPSLLAVLVWQTKRSCPGVGQWTLANLLGTLCLFLLSLRGTAPDWISIVLANASALGAAILFLQGIRLFQGLRRYWWPEYLAGGLTLAAVTYFRYATNNLNARAIAMSAALGAFGLVCGLTLLRPLSAGRRLSTILLDPYLSWPAPRIFFECTSTPQCRPPISWLPRTPTRPTLPQPDWRRWDGRSAFF
jgi:hypothetical protein